MYYNGSGRPCTAVTGEAPRLTRTYPGAHLGGSSSTPPPPTPGLTTHCGPCMPGLVQWAPTPMPQRPGPARVNASAGRRRGGTPGFHTHAQLQQACHRLTHRRQREANCRHRHRQRSQRAPRFEEVRPHRTGLHRGLVRGAACGAGCTARRGGRRHLSSWHLCQVNVHALGLLLRLHYGCSGGGGGTLAASTAATAGSASHAGGGAAAAAARTVSSVTRSELPSSFRGGK